MSVVYIEMYTGALHRISYTKVYVLSTCVETLVHMVYCTLYIKQLYRYELHVVTTTYVLRQDVLRAVL